MGRTKGQMGTKTLVRPGVWRLRAVSGYREVDGRKIPVQTSLTFKGSESAASARLAAFVEQEKGHTPEGKLTVGQWCDQWLEHIRNHPDYSPTTVQGHESTIRKIKATGIANVRLLNVTKKDVTDMLDEMSDRGLKSGTLLNYKHILSGALQWAVDQGHIPANPARLVEVRVKRQPVEAPTNKQLARLIAEATKVDATGDAIRPPEMAHIIKMGAYLGCRRGELCALQWKDWDREGNRLRIDASAYNVQGGGGGTKSPKNGYRRWVSISEKVQAILWERLTTIEFLVDQGMWGLTRDDIDECYIFSGYRTGPRTPMLPTYVTRSFIKIRRAAGLPESIRFHDLRHWSASTAIAAGESFTAVSKRLGHSQVSTTMNIYSHVVKGQDEAIAKGLEDAV